MSSLVVRQASEKDLDALAVFMRAHGSGQMTAERLRHWYFRNPSGSASVVIGESDQHIVGMATTNDHVFHKSGAASVLVGMPQKVLTDERARGQGIFGKLYRASEEVCLQRGVEHFLTITNAASTPIFLSRFGYEALPSPRLVILPSLPSSAGVRPTGTIGPSGSEAPGKAWSLRKDHEHYLWRYDPVIGTGYHTVSSGPESDPWGTAVLRRIRKMRMPFLLLMDLVPSDPLRGADMLRSLRAFAWAQGAVGVLVLKEDRLNTWSKQQFPRWEMSSGFNLLVKGRTPEHTRELLRENFELSFGDLDFF
jgi:hypothetical protein